MNTNDVISRLVPQGARVLDLGCGDGSLLAYLRANCRARVQGIEVDLAQISKCLSANVPVVQQDLDAGLVGVADRSFDVVVLSQTLQVVRNPALVLREILRVGSVGIISFPNFGQWSVRAHLAFRGRMPVSKTIPYSWYDTPNIHHTTLKDFRSFVSANGGAIREEIPYRLSANNQMSLVKLMPNFFAEAVMAIVTAR